MCITFDIHILMIFSMYPLKFAAEVKVNDGVIQVLKNMRVRESTKRRSRKERERKKERKKEGKEEIKDLSTLSSQKGQMIVKQAKQILVVPPVTLRWNRTCVLMFPPFLLGLSIQRRKEMSLLYTAYHWLPLDI